MKAAVRLSKPVDHVSILVNCSFSQGCRRLVQSIHITRQTQRSQHEGAFHESPGLCGHSGTATESAGRTDHRRLLRGRRVSGLWCRLQAALLPAAWTSASVYTSAISSKFSPTFDPSTRTSPTHGTVARPSSDVGRSVQSHSHSHSFLVAFTMYDLNKSGTITKDEFQEILQMMIGASVSPDQVESIAERTMNEADHDNDGSISFAEFMNVRPLP
jgi:hypothetical protein